MEKFHLPPPQANIDGNINEADQHWNPVWFYNQVRNGAAWDYKQQGRLYEDFGNFNYGASGTALGFPADVLLRAAGAANQISDPSRQNLGKPWGDPPYGDDPNDQNQINNGTEYCKCMR